MCYLSIMSTTYIKDYDTIINKLVSNIKKRFINLEQMKTELLNIIRIWMNDNINENLLVNIKEEFIEEIKEGEDITQSDIIFYLEEIMDMKFNSLVTDIYNIVEFEHYNFDREQDIKEIVAKYISNIIIIKL